MSGESILIVSPNWIGDVIMSMPAVQMFRTEHPDANITMLCKPVVLDLWKMHDAPNRFQCLEKTGRMFPMIGKLRKTHFDRACILPNSFRSALIPFLTGIPRRAGFPGQWRRGLLTEGIARPGGHQQFEAMSILGVQGEPPAPHIRVPEESFQSLEEKLQTVPTPGKTGAEGFRSLEKPLITLLPGAARGPSKRWPAKHFIALANRLRSDQGATVMLAGGPGDAALCTQIATASGALNLAGQTTLAEWAALLKRSDCVVSNDSGGMHLATAVGTPVVTIFGVTDPSKTGPLGRATVLQKSDMRSRDVARNSDAARHALESVSPDEAYAAAAGSV